MFCPNCGNSVNDGAKFCPKCGNALIQEEQKNTDLGKQEEKTSHVVPPVSDTVEQKQNDGKGIKIILLIIILALVAVLVMGGAFFAVTTFLDNRSGDEIEAYNNDDDDDEEDDEEKDDDADEDDTSVESATEEAYTGEKEDINIEIRQFDNANFPEMTLYASVTDLDGNVIESLTTTDFQVEEITSDGHSVDASIEEVYRVLNTDHVSINMVLDASGSMSDYNKMLQAKNAAKAFINQMELNNGDQVEIISFDDYVYLEQEFTNEAGLALNAIDNITPGSSTALYDALYAGLYQTYYEEGPKCVIGFTDGIENASNYTYDDVSEMARNTGIPVYIIGIGEEYDSYTYQNLALECGGNYYSANTDDLQSVLEDIYMRIYKEQKDYYVFKYKTSEEGDTSEFRDVILKTSDTTKYNGSYTKSYVPVTDISGAFSSSYINKDYMLDFSSYREVTEADLYGMSLAELRIARNEIFARHGRQFKDAMLNQWFYSKVWYLNLPYKYAPDDFDRTNPNPLSALELENANFIKAYEENIMNTQDIFPNASNMALSEYDLALSKPVLNKAMEQMKKYPATTILEDNKLLLQQAIEREDVRY